MRKDETKVVATNKKAYHDYAILETFEAGIALKGSEVKSLRSGACALRDSYALIEGNRVVLRNMRIAPCATGSYFNPDPNRDRALLMHKSEIRRLKSKVEEKGLTLIVTRVYFKSSIAKAELALCRGKHLYDKRRAEREKQIKADLARGEY